VSLLLTWSRSGGRVVASFALKGEAVEFDYVKLRLAAVEDMTATLGGIAESEWEKPSLCEGWQVRHVPAHLVTGFLFELHQIQEVVAQVGSVAEAAKQGAIQFAAMHESLSIAEAFERHAGQAEPTGIAAVIPPPELFVDQVIHRYDVAVPLGLPTETSEEQLLAALSAMPAIEGFIGSKERASGLRLEATDVPWAWGDGPGVRGPAEAILLALSGRPCGLERCEGEGVATLATKQGVDGRHR
jgi:uncharacterized protein (TIGR03083 family)